MKPKLYKCQKFFTRNMVTKRYIKSILPLNIILSVVIASYLLAPQKAYAYHNPDHLTEQAITLAAQNKSLTLALAFNITAIIFILGIGLKIAKRKHSD